MKPHTHCLVLKGGKMLFYLFYLFLFTIMTVLFTSCYSKMLFSWYSLIIPWLYCTVILNLFVYIIVHVNVLVEAQHILKPKRNKIDRFHYQLKLKWPKKSSSPITSIKPVLSIWVKSVYDVDLFQWQIKCTSVHVLLHYRTFMLINTPLPFLCFHQCMSALTLVIQWRWRWKRERVYQSWRRRWGGCMAFILINCGSFLLGESCVVVPHYR